MPREAVIKFFEDYVEKYDLPVRYETQVLSVKPDNDYGYLVETDKDNIRTKNVIIATGFFQHPRIPKFSEDISSTIMQLHSSKYRNPGQLREGAVLIVGSGQSGSQIAEELYLSGKKVFLCVGTAGRVPRRYRGKDIIEWLEVTGFLDLTPEQLPPGMGKFEGIPHLSGTGGGHTINLHQFAKDRVTLLGHLHGAKNQKVFIKPDLHDSIRIVDQFEVEATKVIDGYIESNRLDAPIEHLPQLAHGYDQPLTEELDLQKEGVDTIIWASGFYHNYDLVKMPAFDKDGFPIQSRGVSEFPGLYFVGMPWMPSEKSGFLGGVGEAARFVTSHILEGVKQD
jgi:putative flavoprotein involved in K+ transport